MEITPFKNTYEAYKTQQWVIIQAIVNYDIQIQTKTHGIAPEWQ